MSVIQEYKCPCCGGAIEFDSSLQKMKCPYCDNEFEMETLASYDDALKNESGDNLQWETQAGGEWTEGETEGLRSRRPSGLRKTRPDNNSLAHRTTWLRSDLMTR